MTMNDKRPPFSQQSITTTSCKHV